MQELISPQQSDTLILLGAVLLTIIGSVWGYRSRGARGLAAGLCGPLLWAMWQAHKYFTRYDPATGYFGLDKVKVLLLEGVLFVALGAALGWAWSALNTKEN